MSKERISLTCETCHKTHDLPKTEEIPAHVFFMRCNWCPECEERAEDYYQEWWEDNENGPDKPLPIPVSDNQLCMPFILDEIGGPNLTVSHRKESLNKEELVNAFVLKNIPSF